MLRSISSPGVDELRTAQFTKSDDLFCALKTAEAVNPGTECAVYTGEQRM
jgi:hypothetical protein